MDVNRSLREESAPEGKPSMFSPVNVYTSTPMTSKNGPTLPDLGPVLAEILILLPLRDRLTVACVSRGMRDFIYDHHELWTNVSASTCPEEGSDQAPFHSTLGWAASRRRVHRLRVTIRDRDLVGGGIVSYSPSIQKSLDVGVTALTHCVGSLNRLLSLSVRLDDGRGVRASPNTAADLVKVASPTLRQLSIVACDMGAPIDASHLTSLTALSLTASGTTVASPTALPPSLKRLSIGGLCEPSLPPALSLLSGLESLSVNWASSDAADRAPTPDLSLLSSKTWTGQMTHLSLGYFEAAALPPSLPPTLHSLDLQWNLQTAAAGGRKSATFDVDAFHVSFSALEPLTRLVHLNLNNALGGWGLPPSVLKLTQLESLGVAGSCPMGDWGDRHAPLAPQLCAFPKLRRLDIDILEAAEGWRNLAALPLLEDLRLGKSSAAEVYVSAEVRAAVGRGLVCLLPSLPALRAVRTEGMLLPATAACGRWTRLLGFEAEELREEAAAAVNALHARGVSLERWYAWPFLPGAAPGKEWVAWDEVV